MKINIVGAGSYGQFLHELLASYFDFGEDAKSVILAVPISAYDELAKRYREKHLVNVCSVQRPSTDIILKYTTNVTCIHLLFGRQTPADKRNAIVTRAFAAVNGGRNLLANNESQLFKGLSNVCKIYFEDHNGKPFSPDSHDQMMARTHVAAIAAARHIGPLVEQANDIPDEYIPNSFRLLRQFATTVAMSPGTIQSILANPYC